MRSWSAAPKWADYSPVSFIVWSARSILNSSLLPIHYSLPTAMTQPVLLFLIFLAVGAVFLAVNLIVGKLVRPNTPSKEKSGIYECGELPVGSSWIQFDLRFYVVALLFVIFDVEIAFFFPWAVVFGNAIQKRDA